MIHTRTLTVIVVAVTLLSITLFGVALIAKGAVGTPKILSYQGRLANSSGTLLGSSSGTNYYFKFSIYNAASGGTKLWPSGSPSSMTASVVSGVFNVGIGDTSAGGDELTLDFNNDAYYLEVQVSSDNSSFETLTPRQRIFSSGYSINADTVDGASAGIAAGNILKITSGGNISFGGDIYATSTGGSLFASSTVVSTGNILGYSNLNIYGTGTSTFAGGISITAGGINFALPSCNTGSALTTDAGGAIVCGTISPSAAGGWTDDGTVVRLTTATDLVGIGTTSPARTFGLNGKVFFDSAEIRYASSSAERLTFNYQKAATSTVPTNAGSWSVATTTAARTKPIFSINGQTGSIDLRIKATSTFTGGIFTDALRTNLASCDSLDTDSSGAIICGSDATGAAFAWDRNTWGNSTSTTLGFLNGFIANGTGSSTFSEIARFTKDIFASSTIRGLGPLTLTSTGTSTLSGGISVASGGLASSKGLALTGGAINFAGDSITDLVGTGLQVSAGALTLNATGDWTGTIDGNDFAGGAIGVGELIYGGSAGSFSELAAGTKGNVLMFGTGGLPLWQATSTLAWKKDTATSTFDNGISVGGGGLASSKGLTVTGGIIRSSGIINLTGTATSTFAGGLSITAGGLNFSLPSCSGSSALTTDAGGGVVCGTISPSSGGGWTDDGTTVRLTTATDVVGIGTTTPRGTLGVNGRAFFDSAEIRYASSSASRLTFSYQKSATSTLVDNVRNAWSLATSTIADPFFSIDTTKRIWDIGRIGIGTTTPKANLHVDGSMYVWGGTGDITNNGGISSLDAARVVQYIARTTDLTQEEYARGDINGDGVVNALDGRLMAKIDAGSLSFDQAKYLGKVFSDIMWQPTADRTVAIGQDPSADFGLELVASSSLGYFGISSSYDSSVNGGDVLTVNAAGRVGIASTSPAALLTASSSRTGIIAAMFDQRGTSDIMRLLDSGTLRFVVKDGGNVGLGATTSPAQQLSLSNSGYVVGGLGVGDATTTSGVLETSGLAYIGGVLKVAGSATSTVANGISVLAGGLNFSLPSCSGSSALTTDAGGGVVCGAITASASPGGSDGQIQYNNGGVTGGGTGFIWDDTNNFLGIGSTTPSRKLSLNGKVFFDSAEIRYASSSAVALTFSYQKSATSTVPNNRPNVWSIATSTTKAPIFSISSSGDIGGIGIGTTSRELIDVADSRDNLFQLKKLSSAFGAAASTGAFIDRNSYFGEEFNHEIANIAADTKGTANGGMGDYGRWGVYESVAASGCTFGVDDDVTNGIMFMNGVSGTASGCMAMPDEALNDPRKILTSGNAPVMLIKALYGPSTGIVYNSHFSFLGMGDDTDGTTATTSNFIGFVNAGGNTWRGATISAGTATLTSCPNATIDVNNFALLMIEVRSINEVRFYVDPNVSDGVQFINCGSSTTNIPTAQLTPQVQFQGRLTTVNGNADAAIDFYRAWQDDAPIAADAKEPIDIQKLEQDLAAEMSIAQMFPADDLEMKPGTIVSFAADLPTGQAGGSQSKVTAAHRAFDANLAGVVVNDGGIELRNGTFDGVRVAFSGNARVNVSLANGPIAVGDRITSSSLPGVGMKAVRPGYSIGRALEAFDPANNVGVCAGTEIATSTLSDPLCQGSIAVRIEIGFDAGIGDLIQELGEEIDKIPSIISDLAKETFSKGSGLVRIVARKIVAEVAAVRSLFANILTILPGGDVILPAGENQVVGEAVFPSGATSILVFHNKTASTTKVFITPKVSIPAPLSVSELRDGEGFVVSVEKPFAYDVPFDWLLITSYTASAESSVLPLSATPVTPANENAPVDNNIAEGVTAPSESASDADKSMVTDPLPALEAASDPVTRGADAHAESQPAEPLQIDSAPISPAEQDSASIPAS